MDINDADEKDSGKTKLVSCLKPQNVEFDGEGEGDDDSKALLCHKGGGNLRTTEKPQRKVQWNDKNGNQLTEVLEFQPSDVSDSDDEDSDTCMCTIM